MPSEELSIWSVSKYSLDREQKRKLLDLQVEYFGLEIVWERLKLWQWQVIPFSVLLLVWEKDRFGTSNFVKVSVEEKILLAIARWGF